jgi:hypothetical protein
MTVQAMKGGAIEFLTKPFRDQDLLDAIQLGLSRDRVRRENEKDLAALRERFASLCSGTTTGAPGSLIRPRSSASRKAYSSVELRLVWHQLEFVGHSAKLGKRTGLHLLHRPAAVHLHRIFGDADIVARAAVRKAGSLPEL